MRDSTPPSRQLRNVNDLISLSYVSAFHLYMTQYGPVSGIKPFPLSLSVTCLVETSVERQVSQDVSGTLTLIQSVFYSKNPVCGIQGRSYLYARYARAYLKKSGVKRGIKVNKIQNKNKIQRIKQINLNYFKSPVRLNSFHNGLLIFLFTPECPFPGKRRDSLVDRIFYGIYLEKQREKRKFLIKRYICSDATNSVHGIASHTFMFSFRLAISLQKWCINRKKQCHLVYKN